MKIAATMLLAIMLSSCALQTTIPRPEALLIVGEIVSRQRLAREEPRAGSNEPDLIVTEVLPVEGQDDFAIAVCQYRDLWQGYALLVRRNEFPFEQLAMFGGDQVQYVESVTSRLTPAGSIITASHKTVRGNDAGTEELLIRTDGSLKWLKQKR